MIEYKNKQYETRELYLGKQQGYRIVAQCALWDAIGDGEGNCKGRKETAIDEQIWYYCDEQEWAIEGNRELLKAIKTLMI